VMLVVAIVVVTIAIAVAVVLLVDNPRMSEMYEKCCD